MPSSTSSSDISDSGAAVQAAFAPVRLTAADRPGIAQPVPVRDIPPQPWSAILIAAAILCALLIGAWELYWRAFDVLPTYRNSNGQWAQQRRRIDQGEGGKTVLIGASRVLFDVQLPVWERLTGERPIQLAMEGTSPVPVMEDLAADPNFTGRLLIGVAPDIFFTGFVYRGEVVPFYHKQSPSQRSGNWLSMTFLEPFVAFYDPDYALAAVVRRQHWAERPGAPNRLQVRRLAVHDIDRNTHLWEKVETNLDYRQIARNTWKQGFDDPLPGMDTPEKKQNVIDAQIDRAVKAAATLRARGVQLVFVRPPSAGPFYAYEERELPRADTWDLLLERTGAPGIHFQDYPELQGYELPEWSHIAPSQVDRFTEALVPIVERKFSRLEGGAVEQPR